MYLSSINIENYRNIPAAIFKPDRHLSVVYGLNGQGKTNLLESVYLLGSGRSFRTARVPDLIRHGQTTASVRGTVHSGGSESSISIHLSGSVRKVAVDGKNIQSAADLQGRLPVVVFSPDDIAMVKLGPETRRRYLDRLLYSCNRRFLQQYHSYYRTLKQRNALLRSGSRSGLDEWTEQLVAAGIELIVCRRQFIENIALLFRDTYTRITEGREEVGLLYRPDLLPDEYRDRLEQGKEQDLRQGVTGRGPHRDDLQFLINGRPLRLFGSQGQQRSFVLALKMVELHHLHGLFGDYPVLLLDDMASELDRRRIYNLLSFLRQERIQTILTTTDPDPLPAELFDSCSRFRVEDGTPTYEEERR
ncbi:DNA replication/repair protein RecF [Trichlorobacter ammonificans]|uniref:DNA replication and repair protein RecF n=1 Tax=Trichlorobacter ammonificans TaxID=2916410 RepID=A0ABM9D5V3_9BACT|nr:DNA replication/repair protein RecF [Trichlorobacter ammonificans]CAH2029827.1 DNA replication and repair protein RecF [Trichlorobacter ammonificans]